MPTQNTTVIFGIVMMAMSRKEASVKPKSLFPKTPILTKTAGLVTLTITRLDRCVDEFLPMLILDIIVMSSVVMPVSKKREVDASKLSKKSRFQSMLMLIVIAGLVTPITIEILQGITALGCLKMPTPNTIATIGTARVASKGKGADVKK